LFVLVLLRLDVAQTYQELEPFLSPPPSADIIDMQCRGVMIDLLNFNYLVLIPYSLSYIEFSWRTPSYRIGL
jgi:hypothetical protein